MAAQAQAEAESSAEAAAAAAAATAAATAAVPTLSYATAPSLARRMLLDYSRERDLLPLLSQCATGDSSTSIDDEEDDDEEDRNGEKDDDGNDAASASSASSFSSSSSSSSSSSVLGFDLDLLEASLAESLRLDGDGGAGGAAAVGAVLVQVRQFEYADEQRSVGTLAAVNVHVPQAPLPVVS